MKFWPKDPLSDQPIGSCFFDWCVITFYIVMLAIVLVSPFL